MRASFIKLWSVISRKYCLKKFLWQAKIEWGTSLLCKLNVTLAGNLFLLRNTCLCLASVLSKCAYRLYENGIRPVLLSNTFLFLASFWVFVLTGSMKIGADLFLLSNTFLCLAASFCAYRLYESGPRSFARAPFMHVSFPTSNRRPSVRLATLSLGD